MTPTYPQYPNLEKFAEAARAGAAGRARNINFFICGEFSIDSLRDHHLADVTAKAELWQALEVPKELFINHGKYIGSEGISYISDELTRKTSSNRALYSLINQGDIIESGDSPIPSFMIFQCGLDEGIFYCTSYFRALELANFFRINLEEMRINILKILEAFPTANVTAVRLSIFSFSAYDNPGLIPLERSKLDLMDRMAIDDAYQENPSSIADLLDAKAAETTVVDIRGLEAIKEWLSPDRKAKWPPTLTNIPAIMHALENAIAFGHCLRKVRHSNSHHQSVNSAATKFVESVKNLAEEFRR